MNFKREIAGSPGNAYRVTKLSSINTEFLTFLSSYVLPLAFLDFSSLRQIILLLVLLVFIGIMYVKTDMFLKNPTLAILGYKLYEIKAINNSKNVDISGLVISQDEINNGDSICYIGLGKNTFYARRTKQ